MLLGIGILKYECRRLWSCQPLLCTNCLNTVLFIAISPGTHVTPWHNGVRMEHDTKPFNAAAEGIEQPREIQSGHLALDRDIGV
jgi:hypothetical protein